MNEAFLEIAKVGGPVVLVVLLLLKFCVQPLLTHLQQERDAADVRALAERTAAEKRDAAFLGALHQINEQSSRRADECHKVHAESIKTIERNTAAYEKFSESHEAMQLAIAAMTPAPGPRPTGHKLHNN